MQYEMTDRSRLENRQVIRDQKERGIVDGTRHICSLHSLSDPRVKPQHNGPCGDGYIAATCASGLEYAGR